MSWTTRTYDVVIVGGGTAGCVIASRLSETESLRVLLLEAGPDNTNDPKVTTPLRNSEMFGDAKYDWNYQTTQQKHTDNRVFRQPRGKMLGGSSAINSHSLVYPNRAMHDSWAEIAGDSSWSWKSMQQYYEKFQTVQRREQSQDGIVQASTNGPIQASYPRRLNKLQTTWREAFQALNSFYDSYALDGKAIGGSLTTNAIDGRDGKGERSHAGKAYLQPASARKNLTIVTEVLVKKIVFENATSDKNKLRATGVVVEKDGLSISVSAQREVVLCAGVFGSPQLLELSGLGSKDILEKAGVQCLLHLPSIGENLQDHLNFGPSVQVQYTVETVDERVRDKAVAKAVQTEYDTNRTGMLSEGGVYTFAYWPLQLFETSSERDELLELTQKDETELAPLTKMQFEFNKRMILHSKEASANVALVPRQRHMRPEDDSGGNYMTLLAMLSHPYSRGSSHITTSDSTVQPVIDFNYLSHPLDMEILARHVVQIERLIERPQFSQILEPSGKRFPRGIASDQRSQADLEQLIRKYSATNYHPCGTCVMAKADLDGVVDANLLVRGVENLRVCDASIFPIIPRGNILSTVYAVAEKGAEIIHSSM